MDRPSPHVLESLAPELFTWRAKYLGESVVSDENHLWFLVEGDGRRHRLGYLLGRSLANVAEVKPIPKTGGEPDRYLTRLGQTYELDELPGEHSPKLPPPNWSFPSGSVGAMLIPTTASIPPTGFRCSSTSGSPSMANPGSTHESSSARSGQAGQVPGECANSPYGEPGRSRRSNRDSTTGGKGPISWRAGRPSSTPSTRA